MPSQLPLPVTLRDYANFDSFFAGPNHELVAALRRLPADRGTIIWIWGDAASGKSHLLQALCSQTERAAFLPADQVVTLGEHMLAGYAQYPLVCIDDVDMLLNTAGFESALFRLFHELVSEGDGTLVVSSSLAPREIPVALADLASRLLSGPVYRLQPLSDNGLLEALKLRADLRGLELPHNTGTFLLRHFKRDMRSLCALLDRLDVASLARQQHRLTIPLVKNALAQAGES